MAGMVPSKRNDKEMRPFGTMSPFSYMLEDFLGNWGPMRGFMNESFKIDVQECGDSYCVEAELPGVKKEELHVALDDGRLTISVNRQENKEEKTEGYLHRERWTGSFKRSIYLPDVKSEGVKAKLEDGVLKVTIPRDTSETPVQHEIPID